MTEPIGDALAAIARQPAETWSRRLRERFPDDPELVEQGLLWLHADRDPIADASTPPSLGAGDARYELGVLLDAGATASVWQAHDRTLARDVAIKLFRAVPTEHAGAVAEILAEARAASEVTSDHVVRILDVHDDGTHRYIVMELIGEYDPQRDDLVPGRSAAICRPTSVREAVRWLLDIARGLHDAHLRNVFHRDLKPANILITPLSRRARIADFGIAISADRVVASAGGVRVAGTPEYMAPEQARGLPHGLSPHDVAGRQALVRIDVWGLGALAHDLLGGSPPWQATHDALAWEVAASGRTPPPPLRMPSGERVPARLRRIVAKAMAGDPVARYGSAAELARELQAILERRPTSLDRSPAVRLALWSRRNPQLTMTAVGAVGLAAAVLVAFLSIHHLRAERAALAAETANAEIENQQLVARMRATRAELERTEASVTQQAAALEALRHALAEGQKDYRTIIDAKEQALHDADVATRKLVEQLGESRSDRDVAEYGRGLYEGFWTSARKDAERLTGERDQAVGERDVARGERDQATKERDAARAARAQAEADRQAAREAADQATRERAEAQAELARAAATAAALRARVQVLEASAHADAGP